MRFRSILGRAMAVPFRDALFRGLAEDGSLYVPETLPQLSDTFLAGLGNHTLHEHGVEVLSHFIDDVPRLELETIVGEAWDFPIPLSPLEPGIDLLELFHGPTLAFKDVGARFMARILSYYLGREDRELSIVVATSGDTGSAVASGFHSVPHITVFVLYPSGRISPLQEKQIATLGGNIRAIEVLGAFDDCQALVKQALIDDSVRSVRELTTANSINVGRLLPQVPYYGWADTQSLRQSGDSRPSFVIPSGNFGNLTAAVYAREMGIPIAGIAAATNANDVVPEFLVTGTFAPRASVATLSNAMDVGNPSNLARLTALFGEDAAGLGKAIAALGVTDQETATEIRKTCEATGRILDPHTAVGVAAARRLLKSGLAPPIIVPATAHSGKFPEVIEKILGTTIPLPRELEAAMKRTKDAVRIAADYEVLRRLLLS